MTGLWPVHDKFVTGPWPIHDKFVTDLWPVHDKFVTDLWPAHDKFVRGKSPVCNNYVTGLCLCVTSLWQVCHLYITSLWQVHNLHVTSSWDACHWYFLYSGHFTWYTSVSNWSNRSFIYGGDSGLSWVFFLCTGPNWPLRSSAWWKVCRHLKNTVMMICVHVVVSSPWSWRSWCA